MPSAVFLVEFHQQQFIVRYSEFRQGIHGANKAFPGNFYYFVIAAYRIQYRFLNSRSFRNFFVHDFKLDKIRVKRYV